MKDGCFISIIMPALNEQADVAHAVTDTLRAFDDFELDGEIIVVNDGSTDRTGEVVQAIVARDPRVRMLRHETPQGIGASFWDGVDHARGATVCMLPGDNENNPWETLRYCSLLEHVDLVIPFVFNRQTRSAFRNLLSLVYRVIINTTFLVNFNYTNGTIIYRRSILMDLPFRSEGFFYQTDILVRTVKKGYLFAEVPYRLNARRGGESKAMSFPSLMQVVRGYLRLLHDSRYSKPKERRKGFAAGSTTAERRGTARPTHSRSPDGRSANAGAPHE